MWLILPPRVVYFEPDDASFTPLSSDVMDTFQGSDKCFPIRPMAAAFDVKLSKVEAKQASIMDPTTNKPLSSFKVHRTNVCLLSIGASTIHSSQGLNIQAVLLALVGQAAASFGRSGLVVALSRTDINSLRFLVKLTEDTMRLCITKPAGKQAKVLELNQDIEGDSLDQRCYQRKLATLSLIERGDVFDAFEMFDSEQGDAMGGLSYHDCERDASNRFTKTVAQVALERSPPSTTPTRHVERAQDSTTLCPNGDGAHTQTNSNNGSITSPPSNKRRRGNTHRHHRLASQSTLSPEGEACVGDIGTSLEPQNTNLPSSFTWVGLQNLSATCYFNCCIQLVYTNALFRQRVMPSIHYPFMSQKQPTTTPTTNGPKIATLQELFDAMTKSSTTVLTRNVASAFCVNPTTQHDASEYFMRHFMPLLSIGRDYIMGKTRCVTTTIHDEEVNAIDMIDFGVLPIAVHPSLPIALQKEYATPMRIDGVDVGGIRQTVTKTTFFVHANLPIVLVFGLNRFIVDVRRGITSKNNTSCVIPPTLDMSPFCEMQSTLVLQPPTIYELSAIVMHGAAHTNHNWAYIKARVPNENTPRVAWFEFNDSCKVLQRSEEYVLARARGEDTDSAYMVLYHRADEVANMLRPPWEDWD